MASFAPTLVTDVVAASDGHGDWSNGCALAATGRGEFERIYELPWRVHELHFISNFAAGTGPGVAQSIYSLVSACAGTGNVPEHVLDACGLENVTAVAAAEGRIDKWWQIYDGGPPTTLNDVHARCDEEGVLLEHGFAQHACVPRPLLLASAVLRRRGRHHRVGRTHELRRIPKGVVVLGREGSFRTLHGARVRGLLRRRALYGVGTLVGLIHRHRHRATVRQEGGRRLPHSVEGIID